jgi:hypothetical protein
MRELLYTITGIIFVGGVIAGYAIKDLIDE